MIYPIHFFNPNISVTIRYCLLLNMLFRMLYWLLFNTSILKKCLNLFFTVFILIYWISCISFLPYRIFVYIAISFFCYFLYVLIIKMIVTKL